MENKMENKIQNLLNTNVNKLLYLNNVIGDYNKIKIDTHDKDYNKMILNGLIRQKVLTIDHNLKPKIS